MIYRELTWTSVVFLPKVYNLDLIIRKRQTNSNWETCYKITYLKYSKMSTSWNTKKKKGLRICLCHMSYRDTTAFTIHHLGFSFTMKDIKMKVAQSCLTLCNPMDHLWNSPDQNTGVRSCSLQGIFPTHGSDSGLPHCRRILYQLSHKGSPRILDG